MKFAHLAAASALALSLAACNNGTNATNTTDTTVTTTDDVNAAAGPALDANTTNTASAADNATTVATANEFIDQAAQGDMYEIESSKLAQKQGSATQVKAFAAQMIKDHTVTTAGLKAAIAKGGVDHNPPAKLDAEHQALVDALKGAKGTDFDTQYIAQQKDSHAKALALHQGYANGGDNAALKAAAATVVPKVQMHLDMLNKM